MKPVVRCAIYTRKSSDEGLDQDFNSLDAQREACAAYVKSQAGEGWTLIQEQFDDGGFSGGNIERPAMKRLLDLVRRKQIDVIVVYKVDRLTRSLGDFARIVEMLDAAGASFVSVTQAFNTTTSMGRLTLNVLLSFAQFEREVTGERIRDKIAASKAKGMWMGGNLPLGYDADGRTLKINPAEAETVRGIFALYLELGSAHVVLAELQARGVVTKRRESKEGKVRGGGSFTRGALYHLLANRVYLGEIPHKTAWHPGLHLPILEPALFDAVQARIAENQGRRSVKNGGANSRVPASPLTGILFDADGARLTPVTARGSNDVAYRYYVHAGAQQGPGPARRRLPAGPLEALVADIATTGRLASKEQAPDWPAIRAAVARIEVDDQSIAITLSPAGTDLFRWPDGDLQLEVRRSGDDIRLIVATRLARERGRVTIISPGRETPPASLEDDKVLIRAMARAEAWKADILSGAAESPAALARQASLNPEYLKRILRLAFLSPRIKRMILDGRRPAVLTLQRINEAGIDSSWERQFDQLCRQ